MAQSESKAAGSGRTCDNELHKGIEAAVVYDDKSAWCEDCHDANLNAADSVRNNQ